MFNIPSFSNKSNVLPGQPHPLDYDKIRYFLFKIIIDDLISARVRPILSVL